MPTTTAATKKRRARGTAKIRTEERNGDLVWGYDVWLRQTTDLAGNAYVTGATHSANFPVSVGAFQSTNGGGSDAFIAKLNQTGAVLVYSTYVGGGNNDAAFGNASDPAGNAYITCVTDSKPLPHHEWRISNQQQRWWRRVCYQACHS